MSAPGTLDLAGIRARAEAATPGPWYSVAYSEPRQYHRWLLGNRSNLADELSSSNAAHIAGMDPPTTLALVDEVERLRSENEQFLEQLAERSDSAMHAELQRVMGIHNDTLAELEKLRARVAELEGPEEAAESVEDEQRGQEAADRAVMSLEAMAFNWIATTDIHKAIAAAAKIAGPHVGKLGSCIHGLVSQAWIEGAGTGFDARRKLTVAAREQIAELERMFDMTREADRRGVDMWREANPGNEMVLPDRGDLVAWLMEQLAARGSQAKGRSS